MNRSTCAICADYLSVSDCAACPCGHTFHYVCIMRWKKESSTCPQCRLKFKDPIKLFFEQSINDTIDESDVGQLKNEICELKCTIKQKETSAMASKEREQLLMGELTGKSDEILSLQRNLRNSQGTNDALKRQLSYLEKYKTEAQRARNQANEFENQLNNYKNINEMIKGNRHDVEMMVKSYSDTPDSLNVVATSFVMLKKEYDKIKDAKRKLEVDKKDFRRKAEIAGQEVYESKQQVETLTNDLTHLNQINKGLEAKLRKLEQAFASPSPRSSAIKRFMKESPAPLDLKRIRMDDAIEEAGEADGSLVLFDGPLLCVEDGDNDVEPEREDNGIDDADRDLMDEFGLKGVGITSINSRDPLKEINKNNTTIVNNKLGLKTKTMKAVKGPSENLPHLKKGYNGMGGQSKVLYIPKKASGFKKPIASKSQTKKVKIPKSNETLSKFLTNRPRGPRLPIIDLSP